MSAQHLWLTVCVCIYLFFSCPWEVVSIWGKVFVCSSGPPLKSRRHHLRKPDKRALRCLSMQTNETEPFAHDKHPAQPISSSSIRRDARPSNCLLGKLARLRWSTWPVPVPVLEDHFQHSVTWDAGVQLPCLTAPSWLICTKGFHGSNQPSTAHGKPRAT